VGVGDGFDHVRHRLQLEPKIQQIKREAVTLMQSGLAGYQVVRTLKTYVYPKVEYALRHLRPFQSQFQGFDHAVVGGLRHLLRLPQSATTEFFYMPMSSGGLGLHSLVEMHHALQVAHAWQMLHSKDPRSRRWPRRRWGRWRASATASTRSTGVSWTRSS
jgi:hypothetical protein